MLIIALTLVGVYSLPIEDNGDQDFSDEQWDYLTGEEHDYDDIDLDDYFDDYIEENFSNVYNNRTLWRWVGNEIPYEFDNQNGFEENYQTKIENAITFLNLRLQGCTKFRYIYGAIDTYVS